MAMSDVRVATDLLMQNGFEAAAELLLSAKALREELEALKQSVQAEKAARDIQALMEAGLVERLAPPSVSGTSISPSWVYRFRTTANGTSDIDWDPTF